MGQICLDVTKINKFLTILIMYSLVYVYHDPSIDPVYWMCLWFNFLINLKSPPIYLQSEWTWFQLICVVCYQLDTIVLCNIDDTPLTTKWSRLSLFKKNVVIFLGETTEESDFQWWWWWWWWWWWGM